MKKTLKGLALASLISSQLVAPLTVFAEENEDNNAVTVVEEAQENEAPVGEEAKGEDNTASDNEQAAVAEENDATAEESNAQEDASTPAEANENAGQDEAQTNEEEQTGASEAAKAALEQAMGMAEKQLDAGSGPDALVNELNGLLAQATSLLADDTATDEQLMAVVASLRQKTAELRACQYASLLEDTAEGFRVLVVDNAEKLYTEASVKASNSSFLPALEQADEVLALVKVGGTIDAASAVANEEAILAALAALMDAVYESNLVETADMVAVLQEVFTENELRFLPEYQAAFDELNAAVRHLADMITNALTEEEANDAIARVRAAVDKLVLVVEVHAVDENGNLLLDVMETSQFGKLNEAWSATAPEIDGYELVNSEDVTPVAGVKAFSTAVAATNGSASNGTFGDGNNKVTFVYRAVESEGNVAQGPENPTNMINTPLQKNLTTKELPKTGEETNTWASIGLVAVIAAAGSLGFIKKRKISE